MTIDEAYVWYRGTPNALSELLEMKCEHEMIVKENKKLRVDWESERDYANQMEAIAGRLQAENAKLKRRLEILKSHGIEIADAVAGGFEIYNKEHARADRLEAENEKLRDIAHDMWRLLLATGNDDLVLSIEASGVVKEVIDAEELAKTMRELGIEV